MEMKISGQEGSNHIGNGAMKRRQRRAVNCAGLVRTAEAFLKSKFVPIAGFSGAVDAPEGAETFAPTAEDMPVDMVINMTEEDEQCGAPEIRRSKFKKHEPNNGQKQRPQKLFATDQLIADTSSCCLLCCRCAACVCHQL